MQVFALTFHSEIECYEENSVRHVATTRLTALVEHNAFISVQLYILALTKRIFLSLVNQTHNSLRKKNSLHDMSLDMLH